MIRSAISGVNIDMTNTIFRLIAVLAILVTITGCTSVHVQDYKNNTPKLVLEDYFAGETTAWGIFRDRFGKVRKRFVVDVKGEWDAQAQKLVLREDFQYDDGTKETREWHLKKTGANSYEGTADNVVGTAKGRTSGNAFHFNYRFDLPVGDSSWRVTFDDWMYLQPDGETLINIATISKWGVRLGTVHIFFRKNGASAGKQG